MISSKVKSLFRSLRKWLFYTAAFFLLAPIVLVVLFKFVDPPIWGWKIHRALFPPEGFPSQTVHEWVSLSAISPHMPQAVIASEDQRFAQHRGVDVDALQTVIREALDGKGARGASTITQQTAKNVFLFPSQTYLRKAYELYLALLLEWIWGKSRIMEVYLNVIEFGPGLYGIEAASQNYFAISAEQLSRQQAAQLAVVLPNPYRIKPVPMSQYVQQRSRWVLRQMNNLGEVVF
ncbi:monofunctional biosynthetic peptidoglycan transglycosylase [Thaumasiovibrio subtropicus]|uniref:monofunctional biosynthetic peptidoglycan transglycosylase n=1 Tax=Thaumasiovibrio subtropicus TaxID=1891207 RepID=UPI000B35B8A3|nr:monofunctional biosynthetic peptidoglycan transglycosylase [Thaumasiovibrio subtropicus]